MAEGKEMGEVVRVRVRGVHCVGFTPDFGDPAMKEHTKRKNQTNKGEKAHTHNITCGINTQVCCV
jgi:hypothetical protein